MLNIALPKGRLGDKVYGLFSSILALTTATASGRPSGPASWCSRMMTSIPRLLSISTSFTEEVPQSTVMSRLGFSAHSQRQRSMPASLSP